MKDRDDLGPLFVALTGLAVVVAIWGIYFTWGRF